MNASIPVSVLCLNSFFYSLHRGDQMFFSGSSVDIYGIFAKVHLSRAVMDDCLEMEFKDYETHLTV